MYPVNKTPDNSRRVGLSVSIAAVAVALIVLFSPSSERKVRAIFLPTKIEKQHDFKPQSADQVIFYRGHPRGALKLGAVNAQLHYRLDHADEAENKLLAAVKTMAALRGATGVVMRQFGCTVPSQSAAGQAVCVFKGDAVRLGGGR